MDVENKILKDLYDTRREGFEVTYINKYGKPEEIVKSRQAEEELTKLIKKIITDEEKFSLVLKKLNDFEGRTIGKTCFWNEQYYKFGFVDVMCFKNEIREEKSKNNEFYNASMFNKNIDEIMCYVKNKQYDKLKKREDYNKIIQQIEDIKTKYPKVKACIEDENIIELSKEEIKAVLDIKNLNDKLEYIGIEEVFKIGVCEGISI